MEGLDSRLTAIEALLEGLSKELIAGIFWNRNGPRGSEVIEPSRASTHQQDTSQSGKKTDLL